MKKKEAKMERMPKRMVHAEVCGTCQHYHQHYIIDKRGYFHPIWYGHCGIPRNKSIEPDKTCEHWEEIEKEPTC